MFIIFSFSQVQHTKMFLSLLFCISFICILSSCFAWMLHVMSVIFVFLAQCLLIYLLIFIYFVPCNLKCTKFIKTCVIFDNFKLCVFQNNYCPLYLCMFIHDFEVRALKVHICPKSLYFGLCHDFSQITLCEDITFWLFIVSIKA